MKLHLPLLAALAVLCVLVASARNADAEAGDEYTVSVLTMSPGDPVFFKFGHIAVLVRDRATGRDEVYNWGTFSFEEPGLVPKFLYGRLTYWLSVQSLRGTLAQYRYEGRWLIEQVLNLTAAQKLRLVALVRENARPENQKYRYDYYRDNCSTRVRDLIDKVTDGSLHAVSGNPSQLTYRGETSRLVADTWWAYLFLNLAMGSYLDQPIAEWDDMFVPARVREQLNKATNRSAGGEIAPLVRNERQLVQADRKPPPDQPPNRKAVVSLAGIALGSLLGWLGYRLLSVPAGSKTPRSRRLLFALPLGGLTTFTGFLGCLFLFFWIWTDHAVAWHNENLLQTNPIAIGMPVVAIGLLRDRAWARRGYYWLSYALAALALLGLLLKALPFWFKQVNGELIGLLLPVWLGLAAAGWLASRRAVRGRAEQPRN
jgi:hypothetical protein